VLLRRNSAFSERARIASQHLLELTAEQGDIVIPEVVRDLFYA
jgi:hypothetical protein